MMAAYSLSILMNSKLFTTLLFCLSICSLSYLNAQNRIGTGEVNELYQQLCAACHGKDLEGGLGLSLLDDEWKHGSSDEALTMSIKNGFPELGMVAYGSTLSDNQIRSLVIYIKERRQQILTEKTAEKLKPQGGIFKTEKHDYKLEKIGEADGILWSIDFMPDNRMLVTQRDGVLWVFDHYGNKTRIAGTPNVWQHGQGGLMEAKLHPDYEENGWIYLGYSENIGAEERGRDAGMTAIVRGRIENNRWVEQESIFHVPGEFHTSAGVHFGTRFVFQDGYLFFPIGDRGRQDQAQDISRPNGKVHRIYDDGRIPEDNPFFNEPNAYKTIWTFGNRNPQGLDAHPITGELWSTEHGPRGGDEANWIRRGRNYGWPVITYGMNYNGTPITDMTHMVGMEQPLHYWLPSIAVCGIEFYTGNQFDGWTNDLFVAGLASQELHRMRIENNELIEHEIVLKNEGRIRDITTGPDGTIYVLLTSRSPKFGEIYKMVPSS